jgi:spore coat protein CotH
VLPPFLQGVASPTTLPTVADVPDLMAFLAADIITMDTDGINGGSGVQDHFQYYDPATGKFFILPWDPDNTFGSNGEMPNLYLYSHFSKSTILTSVRDGADLQKMYLAKLKDTVKLVPAAMLDALVDTIYAQIKDVAHEDTVKQFPNSAFDWNPMYLKMFIDARYAFIISQVGN